MVPYLQMSFLTFLLFITATGKATEEIKEEVCLSCPLENGMVDSEFHSCCEDQEVAEGSNASITFYTDFHLKWGGNTFLEITHYPEHNAAKHILFQWTVPSDPMVRDGYHFDNSNNRTLTLSIPNVTSSHAGEYVMSHILVRHPGKCHLQVRNDIQNSRILSTKCGIPEFNSRPASNSGTEVASDHNKLSTFIAVFAVAFGVVCLISAFLCIAKKHRYLCFKERQNQTTEHGTELLEPSPTLHEQ